MYDNETMGLQKDSSLELVCSDLDVRPHGRYCPSIHLDSLIDVWSLEPTSPSFAATPAMCLPGAQDRGQAHTAINILTGCLNLPRHTPQSSKKLNVHSWLNLRRGSRWSFTDRCCNTPPKRRHYTRSFSS